MKLTSNRIDLKLFKGESPIKGSFFFFKKGWRNMKTIKIGKRIEINIYPKKKKTKYQSIMKHFPYHDHEYFYAFFESIQAANDCLACMKKYIDKYGFIDLYDAYLLMGLNPSFKDTKRGWINLDGAIVLDGLASSRCAARCSLRLPMHISIE